jgi:hypothetical protein
VVDIVPDCGIGKIMKQYCTNNLLVFQLDCMLYQIPMIIKISFRYSTQEPDFCKQFKWLIVLYSTVVGL